MCCALNSALDVAWRAPESADDLASLQELKGWFVTEFGEEVTGVSLRAVETE